MIVYRQKSFSIFQELRHSGKDRVKKKYLGRIKRSLVDKVEKLTRDQAARNQKLNRLLDSGTVGEISNKELARKIVREGRKKGDVRVFDNNKFSDAVGVDRSNYNRKISREELPELIDQYNTVNFIPQTKKVLKSMIDRKNIINLTGDYKDNVATLSHEIGHAMNNVGSAGKKRAAINRLDFINRYKDDPKTIKDTAKRNLVNYMEERNAWKNGMKLLKDNGATKEELKIAKKHRDAALGTYESSKLFRIGEEIVHKYKPEGLDKKIGIVPNSVSESREKMRRALENKYKTVADKDEINDMVNNMKTSRQLYRQQKIRKSKRKDKNILKEMFGNW